MALQNRYGEFKDFDPNKMVTAELAVVVSGDPASPTGRTMYVCFAPGVVKRITTYEDFENELQNATEEIRKEFTEDIQTAIENSIAATTAANAAKEAADRAAEAANAAAEAAGAYVLGDISDKTVNFAEAAARENIATGESTATVFGKIKKWFADLKDAAFWAVANNLTTNVAGSVLDPRQVPVIDKKISDVKTEVSELNTNFEKKAYSYIVSTSSQYENAIAANTWTEVGKANIHVPEDGYYEICAKVIASGTSATTGVCTARLKRDGSEPGINSRSSFPIKSGLMTNTTCITVEYLKAGTHVLSLDVYPDSQIGAGYCSYFVKAF